LEWFSKAAELGSPEAQRNIGIMFFWGIGVEKNDEKAVEWFSKAAESGDEESIMFLKREMYHRKSAESRKNSQVSHPQPAE
jgi:TPR repeat protein